jgi:hypothetical protein
MGGTVLIIAILVCLATNIITSKMYNESNYFQAHLWPKLLALEIVGVVCWFLGRYLNTRPPYPVIDKTTGKEKQEKPNHHLMFIKMEYWGLIFVGIGLVLLLINVSR